MNLLRVDPGVGDEAVPDIEVLIKEARRRQRLRRVRMATVVLALLGLGFGIGMGFFGNDGGGGRADTGAGDGGAGGAPSSERLSTSRVISAALPTLAGYQLSVEHGEIAVNRASGWTQDGCHTRLLSPRTLRVTAVDQRCAGPPTLPRGLTVDERAAGDEIRVIARNPVTGRTKLSPVLMTLDNWNWAHSGAVRGGGAFWIYRLGPFGHTSALLEVSAATGALLHRFRVPAGEDPFMVVDADGFWITQSAYGGSSCARVCTLWHVAPGSDRLVAERRLGVRTQWLVASGDSIYADVLANAGHYGFSQTIWRLDGTSARVAYRTQATLLPSTDFGTATGYVVTGNPRDGFFTLTQLGRGRTPTEGGDCDTSAPIRLVRIDPATGSQSYVATLPPDDAGPALDCHIHRDQAVLYDGAFYVLTGQSDGVPAYSQVVRLPT
jgi:hypothetical protein